MGGDLEGGLCCEGGFGVVFEGGDRWVMYVILYGVAVMLLGVGGCIGADGSSVGEKNKG